MFNGCLNPVRCFGTFQPINKHETFEDLKPLPVQELPTKNIDDFFQQQIKEGKFKMIPKGLTFRSVLLLILIAITKTVLSLFFDEATTSKIVDIMQNILNSLFGFGVAGALWGIRRRISDY